ncbi:hypothetical protein NPIL_620251 [Nephila pilipes]|uniref:Uncharacterized protein n=1 Tax=Nephila pilipes TaxID=299642 RepID=A0A8X6MPS7_NEPPI|nr:hypothetical protein NPIL_620251 [Nephila pilipes]
MTYLVSRSDTSILLSLGVFEIPGGWIPSIQFVGIERCVPSRFVMHTAGDSALCRYWTYDLPSMSYPLWWWICGTHYAVINDFVTLFLLFEYLFFHSCTKRHLSADF